MSEQFEYSASTRVRPTALALLRKCDLAAKASATQQFYERLLSGDTMLDAAVHILDPLDLPGRPAAPELVAPSSLKRRSMQSDAGRAVLLHAITHIEFNAINLALDVSSGVSRQCPTHFITTGSRSPPRKHATFPC